MWNFIESIFFEGDKARGSKPDGASVNVLSNSAEHSPVEHTTVERTKAGLTTGQRLEMEGMKVENTMEGHKKAAWMKKWIHSCIWRETGTIFVVITIRMEGGAATLS